MKAIIPLTFLILVITNLGKAQGLTAYDENIAWMRGGGAGTVEDLRLFPDGKRLMAGATNIKIYDIETGNVLKTLVGLSNYISATDLSKDGRIIAGGGNNDIALWDAETGSLIRQITSGFDVESISLSADGQLIAAGGFGGSVSVWDIKSGTEKRTFRVGTNPVNYLRFSHYGDTLSASGVNSSVKMWDVSSGALLWDYVPPIPQLASPIAFSPDGYWFAFAPNNRSLIVLSLKEGFDTVAVGDLNFSQGLSLEFSPDGSCLVMGIQPGVLLWETELFGASKFVPIPLFESVSLAFSLDGSVLYTGGMQRGEIAVTDLIQSKWVEYLNEYTSAVRSVCWSPDGSMSAASTISSAFVHSGQTGSPLSRLAISHIKICEGMRFSPNGAWLAGGCDDSLRIWTVGNWEQNPRTFKASSFFLNDIVWSSDSRYIVGSDFRHLWRFDLESGVITSPYAEDSTITALKVSPDGQYLIGGGGDGVVRVWDAKTGDLLHNLERHHTFASVVGGVDMAKDGSRFVTGALDGRIILWDFQTINPIREVFHEGGVFTVGLTPDGNYILSGGLDGRIVVWDVESGDSVYVYDDRPYLISELSVSPDGRLVLFGTEDGLVAYRARWKPSSVKREILSGEERVVLLRASSDPSQDNVYVQIIVNPGYIVNTGIALYDMLGTLVSSIPWQHYGPGLHTLSVPLIDVPTGLYFVRLEGEESTQTKSVVIVR